MRTYDLLRRRTLASLVIAGVLLVAAPSAAQAAGQPSAEEIAALVERLGADDYAEREAAAAQLNALGAAAVDPLFTAAEVSGDLEIALRARWLVDTIPLDTDRDSPEVAKLLDKYKRKGFADRVQVMHRLLRVDGDDGIEALARIVRLDRSPLGSRVAAALLAREWQPNDTAWKGMRDRISPGLGGSTRPSAAFLRSVVAFSAADAAATQEQPLADANDALKQLSGTILEGTAGSGDAHPVGGVLPAGDAAAAGGIGETTLRIFQRCHIQMLLAAGQRDAALAESRRLLQACFSPEKDITLAGEEAASTLVWLVARGLPEAVDLLAADRPELIRDDPLVGYAAALAARARHDDVQANTLAVAAFAKPAGTNAEFVDRLQTAILLTKWGGADWAAREYTMLVDDQRTPAAQFALSAIMFSEFLHDQERDDEAAACLRRLLEGRAGKGDGNGGGDGGGEQILQQLGRDPRSIRSRMHYFESCAAALRGDAGGRRRAIEDSLRAYAKDVDGLIGLYTLPDNTPAQKADAVARIRRALEQIENEIQAVPDDTNGYNEYAWLVANTEGDIPKATRYSKLSLVKSFDSSSYLDTLAHCQAAAGNKAAAVRTQMLALRQEPHNRTIRKNLARIQAE
jgi:hypothetical protein